MNTKYQAAAAPAHGQDRAGPGTARARPWAWAEPAAAWNFVLSCISWIYLGYTWISLNILLVYFLVDCLEYSGYMRSGKSVFAQKCSCLIVCLFVCLFVKRFVNLVLLLACIRCFTYPNCDAKTWVWKCMDSHGTSEEELGASHPVPVHVFDNKF